MVPNTRLMLLEFSELTPSSMERFIAEGHLPNFKRLYQESRVFVTDAEESQWDLEPWIQWVMVRTGLSAQQHGLHNLDTPSLTPTRDMTEPPLRWNESAEDARFLAMRN